jgi:hypothetical protein
MVQMYTRIDDLRDVIMRETSNQFEVELRYRENIILQFQPGLREVFPKCEDNAERNAERKYESYLAVATKKD